MSERAPLWLYENVANYGEVAGYIVLTGQPDGTLKDDWDGELHTTFAAGREALAACSEAGWFCLLAECRIVGAEDSEAQCIR